MAKYTLPEYQTMYKDPQSVQINTELRSRFLGAFQADDALGSAVDSMDAADFDGDLAAKQRLTDQYNAQLDDRANRGDYETLGMAITKDARQFVQDYRPIQENKKEYDAWKAKVDASHESYNTGKGGLNNEEYLLMLEKGKHNYAGLQYDDDGKLIDDSYFKGQDFGRSVDEIAELDAHLKGIEANSYENLGIDMPLSDLVMNDDGTINIQKSGAEEGDQVKYWVTDLKGTREYINSDRVEDLAKEILNKPEIETGMRQRVDLNTFKLDDVSEDGSGRTNAQVQIDNEIAELAAERAELMNIPVKTAEDEARLDQIDQELRRIESYRAEGGGGDSQLIRDDAYDKEYNNALKFATGKYSYKRTRGGQKIRLDAEHMKTKVEKTTTAADGLIIENPANQYENPALSGKTKSNTHHNSAQSYNNSLKIARDESVEVFNETLETAGGSGNYTIAEILGYTDETTGEWRSFTVGADGRLIDPDGNQLAADESVLTGMQNMLRTNLENEQMSTQLVNEAKHEVNYAERLEKAVENVTPESIAKGMKMDLFGGYEFNEDYTAALANGTVTDMNDFYKQVSDRTSPLYKSLMAKYDYKETSAGSGIYYSISPSGSRVIAGRNLITGGGTRKDAWNNLADKDKYYTDGNGNKKRYILGIDGTAVDELVDEINREASSDKEELDKNLQDELDKRKSSKVAHSTQRWPGKDDKESKRHQTLVTDFIKEGIPDSFVMQGIDGQMQKVTGGIAALGLKDAKIATVNWAPDPVTGEIMYSVSVEGKDANDVTTSKLIYLNAEQVRFVKDENTDFIKRVQNNTAFKIEHRAAKAQHSYGLDSTSITIQEAHRHTDGTIDNTKAPMTKTLEYDFNTNKVRVFILNDRGKYDLYTTLEIGSPKYYNTVNNPLIRITN
tara:strand:- start:683 stop:3385 length:2703 start_codon:yes stop_codon:yes gene_type:complete